LDSAGKPTKDYKKVVAANGKAGVDYHMLALRFEIDF
jgi:phosphate-selective porin OprO/OprP